MKEGHWIVLMDFTEDETGKPVTVRGPAGNMSTREEFLDCPECRAFKMLDDDGNLYYTGRCYLPKGLTDKAFNPLDYYGKPNAGATTIWYRNRKGQWGVL